jgi:hypothetical protein
MRSALAKAIVSLAMGTLALGCSSSGGNATFGSTPIEQVTGAGGSVRVDVYSAPDPIVRGANELRYVISDATSGAPLDGLTLDVVPWMPAMGHGASITPTVTPEGQGKYLVTDVVLVMAGDWQMRTNISGAATDSVTVTLSVP